MQSTAALTRLCRSTGDRPINTPFHTQAELFIQLGLDDAPAAMDQFTAQHRPLAEGLELWEAPFWSASQAQFLHEAWRRDADWAVVVDGLGLLLSE